LAVAKDLKVMMESILLDVFSPCGVQEIKRQADDFAPDAVVRQLDGLTHGLDRRTRFVQSSAAKAPDESATPRHRPGFAMGLPVWLLAQGRPGIVDVD